MLITTKAFVLRTIRHGDNTLVLKAWTERSGLRTYLVRAGNKRGVAMAVVQPLNRVELVVEEHHERDMQVIKEMRVSRPYMRIPVDPVRGSVTLFIQEVLCKVLRQEAADPELDTFLGEALEALDTVDELSHFPLVFLLQLSAHLGFHPEPPAPGEDRFDLREGHFLQGAAQHGHTLGPALSEALASLLGVGFDRMDTLSIPAELRRDLLDHLLLFYRMHLEGMGELRSPAVLQQVLS